MKWQVEEWFLLLVINILPYEAYIKSTFKMCVVWLKCTEYRMYGGRNARGTWYLWCKNSRWVLGLILYRLLRPGVYFYSGLSCFQPKGFCLLLINTPVGWVLITVGLVHCFGGILDPPITTETKVNKRKYRCMISVKQWFRQFSDSQHSRKWECLENVQYVIGMTRWSITLPETPPVVIGMYIL